MAGIKFKIMVILTSMLTSPSFANEIPPTEDTGIAWGTSDDFYKLASGMELNVKGYWSVTLIKSEAGWKIASLHSSMNAFENAIIDQIKKTYIWVAVGMLIAGLAFGAFFMRLSSKR
jgi:hypothetical protein